MATVDRSYSAYVFDLDGTVYLGDALLPTAGETIASLRRRGRRVLFLSNNPTKSRDGYAAKLARLGLPTPPADIVNSSYVMVDYLQREMPGARLFVVGEASLQEELAAAGFELTDDARRIDAVIASFDRTFDYRKLQIAFDAIRPFGKRPSASSGQARAGGSARFFATNADRYCPVPGGGQPDAAAMIAAIEACTNTRVEAVVGKPSTHMADAILRLAGVPAPECIMIGDRLETDILLGLNAGMATALTLTGATREAEVAQSPIKPTYVIRQLSDLLATGA